MVNPQPEFELTGVTGDVQTVLFNVTTAPHLLTESNQNSNFINFKIQIQFIYFSY